jgi:hypothetical protein
MIDIVPHHAMRVWDIRNSFCTRNNTPIIVETTVVSHVDLVVNRPYTIKGRHHPFQQSTVCFASDDKRGVWLSRWTTLTTDWCSVAREPQIIRWDKDHGVLLERHRAVMSIKLLFTIGEIFLHLVANKEEKIHGGDVMRSRIRGDDISVETITDRESEERVSE